MRSSSPIGSVSGFLSGRISPFLRKLRNGHQGPDRHDNVEDLALLSVAAVVVGAIAGGVVIALRELINLGAEHVLQIDTGKFEDLPSILVLALPLIGVLLIYLLVLWLRGKATEVGVVHVIQRLSTKEIDMPFRNALFQFLGAPLALICGISGGREGPAVHLGAYAGSWISDRIKLSHNNKRVLIACGVAAAVASSFNLPLAGVVFAMEVVLLEYSIVGFLPVILASFTATSLLNIAGWSEKVLPVHTEPLMTNWEYPYIILISVVFGLIGVAIKFLVSYFASVRVEQIWVKWLAAAVVTGGIGYFLPQVLGMSYDTMTELSSGGATPSILMLLAILAAKVFATSFCVAMRLPIGIIGPTIVIGFLAGFIAGQLGAQGAPFMNVAGVSEPTLYALIGMTSLFAVVMNAPLTAMLTTLELTASQNFVVPSMLAIVTATLTAYLFQGRRSVFIETLISLKVSYPPHPYTHYLRCTSVRAAMNTNFLAVSPDSNATWDDLRNKVTAQELETDQDIDWTLFEQEGVGCVLSRDDLQIISRADETVRAKRIDDETSRKPLATISQRQSLEDALELLEDDDVEVLCVTKPGKVPQQIVGILTEGDINALTDDVDNDATKESGN